MPVESCTKNGKDGFRFGSSGVCFTGSDARARALAVGRAISAQKTGDVSQAELEFAASQIPEDELNSVLAGLPFHPDEMRTSWVRKIDEEQRIVWGEIYVPDLPDTQDEFMSASDIEKRAHKFLMEGKSVGCVDVMHDNEVRESCFIVESWISRGDPTYINGSWVVGMKILDDELWEKVKTGEFNGFSMQATVLMTDEIVTLDLPPEVTGLTQIQADGDNHRHEYIVRFDDEGNFQGGSTDVVNGHKHLISRRSVTDLAVNPAVQPVANPSFHRYTLLDQLAGLGSEEAPGGLTTTEVAA